MARLPTVLDYGQRPSLRSTRVDVPGESGLMVADALERAAGTFASVAGEVKQKNDRLNYSLYKNEMLQADLAAREAVRNSEDYEKYDELYTNEYQKRIDGASSKYKLSKTDSKLAQAESDLIRERGRVFAGEESRRKRIDWQQSRVMDDLDRAREAVLNEDDAQLQNDLIQAQLESITAAMNEGIIEPTKGKKIAKDWVTSVATGSLEQMSAEDRIKELELSLARREAQGPISDEDLEKGRGSGSIADYLHKDVATEMLEAAKDELEIEDRTRTAFGAVDAAWEMFPGSGSGREREAYINETLKDLPEARKEALSIERQETNARYTQEARARGEDMVEILNAIDEEDLSYPEIERRYPEQLSRMSGPERDSLRNASQQQRESDGFADDTEWDAYYLWQRMTDADKARANLDGLMPIDPQNPQNDRVPWRAVITRDVAELWAQESKRLRDRIESGKGSAGEPGGLTDTQFFEQYLVSTPYFDRKPVSGDSKKLKDRWAAIAIKWDKAILEASQSEFNGGKVSEKRRREILGQILFNEARVREWGRDPKFPAAAITPEMQEEAYIPLNQEVLVNGQIGTVHDMWMEIPDDGGSQTAYEWIVNNYKALNGVTEPPDPKEIEEIWFYLATQGFDAAKARIRGEKGY